ncbi:hypothetical protein [Nitrincola sp.]|uniref:hypothetical protein n=1 Tax=Nitrincola sp. TaxID=1926584 RepID=UPI003A8FC5F2
MIEKHGREWMDHEISLAQMSANEWRLGMDDAGSPVDQHWFYLVDTLGSSIQAMGVNRAIFDKLGQMNSGAWIAPEECASEIVSRVLGVESQTKEGQRLLAAAITAYIPQTQAYLVWLAHTGEKDQMHFILMIYPGGVLRPQPILYPGAIIPVPELMANLEAIMSADKAKYPEWF